VDFERINLKRGLVCEYGEGFVIIKESMGWDAGEAIVCEEFYGGFVNEDSQINFSIYWFQWEVVIKAGESSGFCRICD